ncbi:Conserved hypothetical protein [Streptococcus sanguinis SK36]|jgi:hypothetical protein|uniref:DUF3284 domain-containing protein n=1 Tax=Streptococcus sanguinis (strain SK36) TaxID=388919 RepID=A3CMZ8_STRSV|nr:DUF3284 domain-containing protein [Streptococcus sanguinis]ABN44553.1 Conserved hypothetical protein [Streptococcus sanguinis SK36]MBZ2055782.1 DUF3284 domain-containing protein [Streptococcus sanguinis]MCY7021416.1 DUF3284 domain-containing protein [Streptococcus sanguinis]
MKIIRELQVTSDEFYDFLENEFLNQINQADNQTKKIDRLKKGLRYSKLSDNVYTKTDYEILDYHRHETYVIQISSHSEKTITSYKTKPCAKGLEVTLEQEQNKLTKNSKSKLIKWMGELLYFGRLSENLYKIQGEIEKTRKEKTQ